MHLTTAHAAAILRDHGAVVSEGSDVPVTGGAADSRNVRPGDLFAAYPGEQTDGNLYTRDAIANGAVAVVCNELPADAPMAATIGVVPDTIAAMAVLAREWRRACPAKVVGVTGTVGKTTTKEFIADLLSQRFFTHRSEGNFNSREGLPLALMSLRRDHEVSVLEVAMDSKGEIAELCRIAEPQIGVVLNVGLTHVSKLGSIEAIQAEKLALARALPSEGTAILNADDPRVAPVAAELNCRVITVGESSGATLRVSDIEDHGLAGTRFMVSCGRQAVRARSTLPGAHTIPAVSSAIATACALGVTLEEAVAAAGAVKSSGRMRILETAGGATIIDDRYNASPASMAGALRLLSQAAGGRRIALIGRMAELGEYEEAEHRAIGTLAAGSCDLLAAVGEPCRALVEAARTAGLEKARWFDDKEAAAAFVRENLSGGDTLLVKASRSQAFETLLPLLGVEP